VSERVRPKTEKHLGQLAQQYANANELDLRRIRQRMSAMMFVAALDRVGEEDTPSRFVIKGGLAIELRFQARARMTRDMDAVFTGDLDALLADLDEAFDEPYSGFTFTYTKPEPIRNTDAHRLEVKIDYEGRSWSTLRVEVSPAEGGSAEAERVKGFNLGDFRLEGPEEVSVQSLRYQAAQKIHACTETFDEGENDRAQDLLDLQLISELVDEEALERFKSAGLEIFGLRAKQSWPPTLTPPESWRDTYPRIAEEANYPVTDLDEAVRAVQFFIDRIDAADSQGDSSEQ
jgi:hypothetical protein